MTRINILNGIYADAVGDFIQSYPRNREPVIMGTGMSDGYLRLAPGTTQTGTGPGKDRGGINWNGTCYRVMGTKLVSVTSNGDVTELGDVGSGGKCSLDYSFDNLIVVSGENLFYWNQSAGLRQVTDPDLGVVLDAIWIDGYTMTTDGSYIAVTELNDPMSVDPLKYGSSEEDPDPIVGLFKIRGEVYAINSNTIEVFQDVGGNGFPFQKNSGAEIPYGAVGTHAKALFLQSFAFVGSARNEAPAVYLAGSGSADKLSTRLVDNLLAELTDAELAAVTMESRIDSDEQRLLVHLPDQTLVYYATASARAQDKVWAIYSDGVGADQAYQSRYAVMAYGKWVVGDDKGRIGNLDMTTPRRFGEVIGWQFDTALLFNENGRGIVNAVELTGLPGRAYDGDPRAFLSYTLDGVTWSQEYAISTGSTGQRAKRMQWRKAYKFNSWLGLRFRGADGGMAAFARLDLGIEALNG